MWACLKEHKKAVIFSAVVFAILAITISIVVWVIVSKTPPALVITIGHIGDMRARFNEIREIGHGQPCEDPEEENCIGGFARVATMVKELREKSKNFLLFNTGNNFVGSSLYTNYKWNITARLINKLEFDAITLGIHDFDDKLHNLENFIKGLESTPITVCNVNDSYEPTMKGLIRKSLVLDTGGKRIGIIGVISSEASAISSPGNLSFEDEITSMNEEATRLVDEEDVFTVIVLSSRGFHEDAAMAEEATKDISVIVGGSQTLLYNGAVPSDDLTEGYYPVVLRQEIGHKVLIVHAASRTKYLGNITISYNKAGETTKWSGNPIYLDNDVEKDEDMEDEISKWNDDLSTKATQIIGVTLRELSNEACFVDECIMGDLIADAMVDGWKDYEDKEHGAWTYASLALVNSGSVKNSLLVGNISFADIQEVQPYQNTFDCVVFLGTHVREILLSTLRPRVTEKWNSEIYVLQQSGFKLVYNCTTSICKLPVVKVRCQNCSTPQYEEINDYQSYRVVLNSYMVDGLDEFKMIPKYFTSIKRGSTDMEILVEYIKKMSPLNLERDNRTIVLGRRPNFFNSDDVA